MLNTAKVEIGAKAVVFGLGGIRLNGIQGLKMAGADRIIGVDLNDDKEEWGRRFGMTHFVNPKKLAERALIMQTIVDMTKTPFDRIGGADYSFDCTGNVKVMRDALECTHRGWGQSIIIGVAPAGAFIEPRPFQMVTGRVWKGTAFGGARGGTDVPKIVDGYMDGKIEIDPVITHILPLARINEAFDLMHEAFTSARSGENYHDWWPNAPMVRVMRRSIDLMEDIARETGTRIAMTRRGSLLAARQLVRVAPLEALEPHPLDPEHRVVAGPGLVHAAHLRPEEHVVQNRAARRPELA